jgi:WD40 repeat protein
MPIRLRCECGELLHVKEEHAGKRTRCPACQTVLVIPARDHVTDRPSEKSRARSNHPDPASAKRRGSRTWGRTVQRQLWPLVAGVAAAGVLVLAITVAAVLWMLRSPGAVENRPEPVAAAAVLASARPEGKAPEPRSPAHRPEPPKPAKSEPAPKEPPPAQGQLAVKELGAPVERVAWSPDGKLLAAATQEQAGDWSRVVHVWDTVTYQPRAALRFKATTAAQRHQQGLLALAFSPDGKTLVAVCYHYWTAGQKREPGQGVRPTQLVLWELATARERAVVPIRANDPNPHQHGLAYAPDGSFLATVENDDTSNTVVRLRHPDTGQIKQSLPWSRARSSSGYDKNWLGFSADGRTLAALIWPGPPRFWDLKEQREVRKVRQFNSFQQQALSPDLKMVVAGGNGSPITWHDVDTGKALVTFNLRIQLEPKKFQMWGPLSDAVFSPDSRVLAAGSSQQPDIKLWDVAGRKEFGELKGHGKGVTALAFSPDGKRLFSGSADGTARVWGIAPPTGKPEPPKVVTAQSAPAKPPPAGPKPIGLDGLPELPDWRPYPWYTQILGAAFSPDGRFALSGGRAGRLRLWYTQNGADVRRFIGHTGPARAMGFSPDGTKVLSCGDDKTIRVWEVATGLQLLKLEGHTGPVTAAAFSAVSPRVLSGSHDQTVRLWDAETGKELKRFDGVKGRIWSVALSADGRRALTGGATVQLWDADSGKELRKLDGHAGEVMAVAFSRDGRRALSGGADKTVRHWDVDSGKELRKLTGHADSVLSVAFTPDARQALTGSLDQTARLWDLETGKEVGRCVSFKGPVVSVAVSPDGPRTLAAEVGLHFLASADAGQLRLLGMPGAVDRPRPKQSLPKLLEQPVCIPGAIFFQGPESASQMLQYLSSYCVKMEFDQAAWNKLGLNAEMGFAGNWRMKLLGLRGVRLDTALRIVLNQMGGEPGPDRPFVPPVTYAVRKDRVVIVPKVPPRPAAPRDESASSPLTKKLAMPVSFHKATTITHDPGESRMKRSERRVCDRNSPKFCGFGVVGRPGEV